MFKKLSIVCAIIGVSCFAYAAQHHGHMMHHMMMHHASMPHHGSMPEHASMMHHMMMASQGHNS